MKRLLAPLCALLIASPVWGQPGPVPPPAVQQVGPQDTNGNINVTQYDSQNTPYPSDLTYTFTATGNGDMTGTPSSPVFVNGYRTATCAINSASGTAAGTVNVEVSRDASSAGVYGLLNGGTKATNSTPNIFSSLATTSTNYVGYIVDANWLKLVVSSFSGSGTITATCVIERAYSPAATVVWAQGNVADGSAASGNPVNVSGVYTAAGKSYSTGQVVTLQHAANGALLQRPFAVAAVSWQKTVTLSDTTNTALHAACGSNLSNYVTSLDFSGLTTTTAVSVSLNDNTTAVWSRNILAGGVGAAFSWETPKAGSTNTAMNVQLSGSPTGAVTVNASGFCAP